MTEDELILTAVLNCSRADLLSQKRELSDEQKKHIADIRSRRNAGEPLQYILGFTEFMGLPIIVNHNVLIPRPETEYLIEKVLSRVNDKNMEMKVLDLCTGSGNVAIALAYHLPKAKVTAVDISEGALEIARYNAVQNKVDKKITFFCSPLDKFLYDSDREEFDLIVSNPPYVPSGKMLDLPQDVQAEPKIALDGGEDGMDFYRLIINNAYFLMQTECLLALETGEDQRRDLEEIVCALPYYKDISFETDLNAKERYLFLKKGRS
jgi:release factor glutamine methyltransferase